MTRKALLIVCNMPSENTTALANAILSGATDDAIDQVSVTLKEPLEATVEDVLAADGIILGTTENFGYMSGALKDFFERIYYPCLDDPKRNDATPYSLVIRAGLDGTGTEVAVK